MQPRFLCRATALWLAAGTAGASAQTPPDAGALQQQIERERQQQLPRRLAPEKPAEPPSLQPRGGITVTVREFRFAGNTLIAAEQLAPALAGYLDRPLDFAQLQAAAAAVATAYREAGWIVRTYLPQQDIDGGIVTIQVVEAVFGGASLDGPEPTRLKLSTVLSYFSEQQKTGEPLNADALDRALLLADDLPGITVAGTLRPGQREGETDLVLKLADEALAVGEVGLDNAGAKSTGDQRLTANLSLNSPAGLGDLLGANLIRTRGSDYARLAYSLPVGNDGWRLGASFSELRYRLLQKPYDSSTDKGSSTTLGLDASYPLLRSRLANFYVNLNYDHKAFDNRNATANAATGGIASRYKIDAISIGLAGNLFDNLGGGGANSANLALVFGDREAGINTVAQHFGKLRFGASRQQVITSDVSLYGALSGQQARRNLDSSERFYLGGAGGVRAYPASEAGGSSAYSATVELRWKLPDSFLLTGFVDSGAVRNYENAGNQYSLSGGGLSLGWQGPGGLNLKLTWASRIGDNPHPADAHESVKSSRWWMSASLPF